MKSSLCRPFSALARRGIAFAVLLAVLFVSMYPAAAAFLIPGQIADLAGELCTSVIDKTSISGTLKNTQTIVVQNVLSNSSNRQANLPHTVNGIKHCAWCSVGAQLGFGITASVHASVFDGARYSLPVVDSHNPHVQTIWLSRFSRGPPIAL